MKGKDRPRFDIDGLRELAGGKTFARGDEYHRDGLVQILALEPGRVLAQVEGSEDYRVALTGRGKDIDGECSCPAFVDWGFCKHMVATAPAANQAGDGGEAEGAGVLSRIRDHLKEKGVDALVEMIVALAERDPALFRKLEMAAATVSADDKTLEARLRKAIDGATRTAGFVDYHEAGGWAANVEEALDAVADLALGGRGALALKLIERAIDRIEGAVESIDDSDGHCSALLERACEIHLAAARAERPDPVRLARRLFEREMDADWDAFGGAAARYADVLGEVGLAEYRRRADEAWGKLPPRTGKTPGEPADGYYQLIGILDFFAQCDGDVDARIALRAKDLSSPWSYLQLAEFCLAHGREEEALRRAEEGLWMFEDGRPDERLVLFAAGLMSKAGRGPEAETHLWRTFEKAPSLPLYTRLRKLGGEAARERAVTSLEGRLGDGQRTGWGHPADFLVSVLVHERDFGAAWAAVGKHGASLGLKERLAGASETTHPREAVQVHAERVELLASRGGDPGYAEAAALIARMAALWSAGEHSAYVTAVKQRHGRKRNLMKLLG